MRFYYLEKNGDYLCIETDTNHYYRSVFGEDHFEGRSACIAGLPGSVCTGAISRSFLKSDCKRVARANVPAEWLEAIA